MDPTAIDTELRERRAHARTQTQQADTKAAALAGAVVPGLAAAIAAGALVGLPGPVAAVGWAAAALGFAVLGELGAVLWPRRGTAPGKRHRDSDALLDFLEGNDPRVLRASLAAEVCDLAAILDRKYRWLRRALTTATAAAALAALTLILAATT
ncbi:Pycsar system effector family protein [Glycomyces sp. MUSA5-2]|uniref:Pycsar system effector family protein n=1 Tax=Glycomyces sp. MUSA5-2 TaxID=2053002 RepID=UPI0030091704